MKTLSEEIAASRQEVIAEKKNASALRAMFANRHGLRFKIVQQYSSVRIAKGISLSMAAKKLGCCAPQLQKIEIGTRRANNEVIVGMILFLEGQE